MIASSTRVRLLARAAALVTLAAVTGCSNDSGGTGATTSEGGTAAVSTVATASSLPSASTTSLDEAAMAALPAALTALDAGYHFVATVSLNGEPSLVAEGDRIGAASRLEITSSGATVSYVITPEGNFAKPADGDWERLEVAPASSDPIAALRAPVQVVPSGSEEGRAVLTVTVTATSLGINAEGTVDVEVVLVGGAITEVRYSAAVEGGTAEVVTMLSALADATPITAPI